MKKRMFVCLLAAVMASSGCDVLYGVLHKPGGEERKILGEVVFNEYNPKVESLQQTLKAFGYNIGRADGKFGPGTRDAVAKFQTDEGLEVTRFIDRKTWERIESYLNGPFFKKGELDARNVQAALKKAGYLQGKVDGQMGAQTREAIKAFQRVSNLSPDGHAGLKTLKVLKKYAE